MDNDIKEVRKAFNQMYESFAKDWKELGDLVIKLCNKGLIILDALEQMEKLKE